MFSDTEAFSSFAVDDAEKAKQFYEGTLGIGTEVLDADVGLLNLHLAGGRDTLVYHQSNVTSASYTVLNFEVDDIDAAVDELAARGVRFERYDGLEQDSKGISRAERPYIAWFRDRFGNVLSLLQER
jgi:catechol 2,3-dioxygenase-like lactoylglutathione lyase family enzyme